MLQGTTKHVDTHDVAIWLQDCHWIKTILFNIRYCLSHVDEQHALVIQAQSHAQRSLSVDLGTISIIE